MLGFPAGIVGMRPGFLLVAELDRWVLTVQAHCHVHAAPAPGAGPVEPQWQEQDLHGARLPLHARVGAALTVKRGLSFAAAWK